MKTIASYAWIAILMIGAFGIFQSSPLYAGQGRWDIQVIDSADIRPTSIAIDSSNRPHIAYVGLNAGLKYANLTDSGWNIQTIEGMPNVGAYCSLALDSFGRPHIAYYDIWRWQLKYAHWNGSQWIIQTHPDDFETGKYCSIAIDSANRPHIAYESDRVGLMYTYLTDSGWTYQTVDPVVPQSRDIFSYISLALDSTGKPHISYYQDFAGLKYAHLEGTSWNVQTITSDGPYNSICLDLSDMPRIAYFSIIGLKYSSFNNGTWITQVLDSNSANYISLRLDSSQYAHISYYKGESDLKYTEWDGTKWNIQTVDHGGDVGWYSDLALDSGNIPNISYWDHTNKLLKYTHWVPNNPSVDSGDYNGDGTSDIAVFRQGAGSWTIKDLTTIYFGSVGDLPACGDYDNDGTSEIALFRPRQQMWVIHDRTRIYFGSNSDYPVPGDYNGDGRCDIAVFRESTGLWAVKGLTRFYFGTAGDQVVPGYYGGGKAKNAAIFRPSNGLWAIRGLTRFYFGQSTDNPIPTGYLTSYQQIPSIFRSGLWAIRGCTRIYCGMDGDQYLSADIDGDGADDIGTFRPKSGQWAIHELTRVFFGGSGDQAIMGRVPRPVTPTPQPSPSISPQPSPTASPTPSQSSSPTPTPQSPTPTPTPMTPLPTPEPSISSSNSACQGMVRRSDDPESLEATWDTDHIHVRHHNAEYNCCIDRIDVRMESNRTEFRLYETEVITVYCYCDCLFDVYSDINDVVPGEYTISVYKKGVFWRSVVVQVL